jgi:hypothetical protein
MRWRNTLDVSGVLCALALAAACAPGGTATGVDPGHVDHPHRAQPSTSSPADAAPSVPATVEQLATELGCEVYADNTTADFRQASCRHPTDHYVLLTFTAETGRRDWLNAAKPWGGTYLVGQRWVVVANDVAALEPLRDRVGGEIQLGEHH